MKKEIKSLKNNKAAGPDNIPAEVLRANICTSVNVLHGLLIKIWDQEYIPSEWREEILVKLYSKNPHTRTCGLRTPRLKFGKKGAYI